MKWLLGVSWGLVFALTALFAQAEARDVPRRFNLQIDEQRVFEQQPDENTDTTPLKKLRVIEGDQVELRWFGTEPI